MLEGLFMTHKGTTEEFVKKAKKIHGDKYDYNKVKYVNNSTKVYIICPEHGEFSQTPNAHLRGRGCSKCGDRRSLEKRTDTLEDFIKKARKTHGDKYDYSKSEYVNSATKIRIICPEHGEFLQRPNGHIRGQGCPKCGKYSYAEKRAYTLENFIEKARRVHGNKYDYSKSEYVNIATKIRIICPEHGEFSQVPGAHTNGSGCPKCAGRCESAQDFITNANKVHANRYDYKLVEYKNSHTPVSILCQKHGEFRQMPYTHLQGGGCPKCAKNYKLTTERFIKKAREIHGDKYDYSKVEYIRNNIKVPIVCPDHGEFLMTPNCHLSQKQNCPECAKKELKKKLNTPEIKKKIIETKRKNGSFNTSKPQEYLKIRLFEKFGKDKVDCEYNDSLYPWHCDFHIKEYYNVFIELNAHWTHGPAFFDKHNREHIETLKEWKSKAQNSTFYEAAVKIWSVRDVEKRNKAKENNLNYIVLWSVADIDEWFEQGCPIRQDW